MSGNVLTGYNVAFPITASDTVNAPYPFDAVYVGNDGNLAVVLESGVAVTFVAVPVGVLQISGIRINSTNTTAGDLTGLRRV